MTEFPKFEIGHISVFVTDIDKMAEFYRRVLGFRVTDGGPRHDDRMSIPSRISGHHHQVVLVTG